MVGGDFWEDLIKKHSNNEINSVELERELTNNIKKSLRKKYKYVLNIPVYPSKSSNISKYRLFHITNHVDGCYLMVKNTHNAFVRSEERNRSNQLSFFEDTADGRIYSDIILKEMILKKIEKKETKLTIFLCDFFTEYGIVTDCNRVKSLLTQLEKEKLLVIKRSPSITKTNKLSTFMEEGNGREVKIIKI